MNRYKLIRHAAGAPGMRFLGIGPGFIPNHSLLKLQRLLDKHAFWAQGRTLQELKLMLSGSSVTVSLWRGKRLIGFGRASSDGIYRAVLWDIIVAGDLQGQGLGKAVVLALINSPKLKKVERIYLMTTNSSGFYEQMGFKNAKSQSLLYIRQKENMIEQ